jgi:ferric-dicitrate binding protein FerR (iron transport regulator)
MNEHRMPDGDDESDIARLLARTGPRSQPSAAAASAVRDAVEAEWRRQVDARAARRRYTGWAVAAGVTVAAVGAWLASPLYLPGPAAVATVARVVGDVSVESSGGQWVPLSAGSVVESGTVLSTGSGGRAALDLESGVQVRLDVGTELAFNGLDEATLARGTVYVDSGPGPEGDARFVLETPAGDVRHLGTQYSAAVDDGALRVAVREGRVEVTGQRASVVANAGEQLMIEEGRVTRSALARNAPEWDWVAKVVPPFEIEGRTVHEFLAWASRETGHEVAYASPEVEQLANRVTLSGNVEGLPPQQAVDAVLATTSLSASIADGRIEVVEDR